ncbi:hypothetical protein V5E97_37485 [Singulisphaera sp. Ch08]|uniref:Glycosyltransferase RgtA/B/C/D-like domain-containing protein n=1 Tax=Singulisphaera sp. Ch08 TaxID=3120278 RepID=A0AAU7CEL8_9BACT
MEKFIRNSNPPRWVSPVVSRVHPARPWLLGAVYLLALVPLSFTPKISGNVSSRYMTIEGIVERGTLAVESSPLRAASGSPDLVRFGRHLYSDKPPVLSVIGAAVYAIVYQSGSRFSGSMAEFVLANWVLVTSIVGVASALTLVWLRQLLQAIPIAPWAADALTLGFGFGSLLLSYGVTFNNHSVAAGLVTGALALTILEDPQNERSKLRRAMAGYLAGLTAAVDLPAGGVLLVALSLWLTFRSRRLPWSFLSGAFFPLLFHSALQSMVTGTPLPVEMYPKAFDYPGSYWATAGVWTETGPRWRFGLELLFGPQGWMTVTPVLLFAVIGLYSAIARRDDPLRPAALAVGGMVVVLLTYYVWGVRRTDYAGQSFGTRHLLAITPACFFFAVVGASRLKRRSAWVVFVILLVVGGLYGVAGVRDPWSRIEQRVATDPLLRVLQKSAIYPWSSYRR